MKVLALLLFLFVTLLLAAAEEGDEEQKCLYCFDLDGSLVCSKGKGTFYNLCQLQCNNAEYLHDGACDAEDLEDNIVEQK